MPYKTTPSINQLLNLNHHHHLCKPPSEWKQLKCNSVTLQPPHFMSLQGICTCHMYIVRLHCTSMCRLFTLCRYTLETMYLAQVQGEQAVPEVPGIGTGGAGKYMQVTLSILCPCLLTRHPGKYYWVHCKWRPHMYHIFYPCLLSDLHFPTRACRPIFVVHLPSVSFL